jgi:transposase
MMNEEFKTFLEESVVCIENSQI